MIPVPVYWNKRTQNCSPYVPGEQPKDRAFIKLNTNENPYPPSPKVIAAIQEAACDTLRLYPDPLCTEFREAAAKQYGVKAEQVFPGNGSDEVLAFVFGAFFESAAAGESAPLLFPDITYSFYPVYARLWDIPCKTIPLAADFSINAEDYLVPSGGVIFPNPNAPTGTALSLSQIRMILDWQKKADRVVVIDEAYAAFGADSVVPLLGDYPNLLTVHTLSKSASLAGLRTGFAIGSAGLIEGLFRIRDSFNSYTMDRLALAGARAAVEDAAYYDKVNKKIAATRERVSAELLALGFEVIPSRANFVFIRRRGISGSDLFARLRRHGILVRHFNSGRTADYLRVSIGTNQDMDAFLDVCKKTGEQK
ncbi:MAG: histidinol-phosphate transaminase [Treponema sp.]|jgi:histidinol-phosphate aminotransferase|nr:histidinol-phosphate transaminase [Treponema sp.]